ncbi:MAG TPA: ABC transporter permease, partial [Blastocatellia bacterium]|nr:ABC transporter permease [Blastocatellia bacterium]
MTIKLMRFVEAVKLALSSLRAHKLRSFLTLLGVIFGVMTVVVVAAVIEGFFRYIDRTVTADLGVNTVVLDKFGIITSFEEYLSANRRNKDLHLDDLYYLRERMTLAQEIAASGSANTEIRSLQQHMNDIYVRGVSANMVNIDTTQADLGRYISDTD